MNVPSQDLPWVDLGRWFAGELSAEEAESLARWVAGDPERAAVVAALREAWTAAGVVAEGWDPAAALRRVREDAALEATVIARLGTPAPAPLSHRLPWARSALRVAAVLAALAGGAALLSRAARDRAVSDVASRSVTEYRAARGQRVNMRLADGTQVTLAPGSVLRQPADYGQRARLLELDGEAYFIVTHDAARPFSVRTDRLVARDLGTRFVVRAYRDEATADVLVAEGEVAVQRGTATPALLVRGQRARVDSGGRVLVESDVEPESSLAWTEGQLVFHDTPLADVAREFERWYDVKIRLASPTLTRLHVRGVFGSQSIAEELHAIAVSLGLGVRRIDGGYELYRAGP